MMRSTNAAASHNALRVAERLHDLAAGDELHPEERVFLRALLAGDTDARAALERADGRLLDRLLAAVRESGERRAILYVVKI